MKISFRPALPVLLVCLLSAAASAVPCSTPKWSGGSETSAAGSVKRLTAIDYDDDGKVDLAGIVAGMTTIQPSVQYEAVVTWKGNGDGTFGSAVTLFTSEFQVYGALADIATADVNVDGKQDLLVGYSGLLKLYLGTGSGLSAPKDISLFQYATGFGVGNWDADAWPELAVATAGGYATIYDASGSTLADVTFTKTQHVTSTDLPLDAVGGDFDGDGRYDLAYTERITDTTGVVKVHFRNSNGTLATGVELAAGSYPSQIASGDFNNDGRPDLVVTNWYDGSITIYRTDGSRVFSSVVKNFEYPEKSGGAHAVLATDVSGDGLADIVPAADNGGWVAGFVSAGAAGFRTPSYLLVQNQSTWLALSLAAADFDNDGDVDLAVGTEHSVVFGPADCATQVLLTPQSPLISAFTDAVLNVSIAGFAANTPAPLGNVTLRKGLTTIETKAADANGKATFSVSGLEAGSHTFAADFAGNADAGAATSNEAIQQVTNDINTVTINPPDSDPMANTSWPITVSISSGDDWFDLFVDGVAARHHTGQTINLNLPAGPHSIYAKYYGSAYYPAATSDTLEITVLKYTPTFTRSGGDVTVRSGQEHSLQFSITGSGPAAPTGTVKLYEGGSQIGTANISSNAATVNVTLTRGVHPVTAVYSGDGNYSSSAIELTLSVVANQPFAIEAHGLPPAVHISFVVPDGTTSFTLNRRTVGGPWAQASQWSQSTGFDGATLARGVVYQYQMVATVDGLTQYSNIDGALLFTDDPVTAGGSVNRAHWTELRAAVNLLRGNAGLSTFSFAPTFDSPGVILADHLLALRTAAAEARSALGMSAVTFDSMVAPGNPIKASQIQQVRDAVR